ncbi:MAG: ankyrin repeat domain-containing protein [Candidatus Desantisbacteria bacterium]
MYRIAKILMGTLLFVVLVSVTVYSQDLNSELYCAAKEGNTMAVKSLIDKGAKVNAKDKDGLTALIFATQNGHTEIVRLLKQSGAKSIWHW